MNIRYRPRRFHHPDLFDWAAAQDRFPVDPRIDWIARRVPRATALMLAENAGFLRGDR